MNIEATGIKVVLATTGGGIVYETISKSVEQGSVFAEITPFHWIMATIALLGWLTTLGFGIYDRWRKRQRQRAKLPSPKSNR